MSVEIVLFSLTIVTNLLCHSIAHPNSGCAIITNVKKNVLYADSWQYISYHSVTVLGHVVIIYMWLFECGTVCHVIFCSTFSVVSFPM